MDRVSVPRNFGQVDFPQLQFPSRAWQNSGWKSDALLHVLGHENGFQEHRVVYHNPVLGESLPVESRSVSCVSFRIDRDRQNRMSFLS